MERKKQKKVSKHVSLVCQIETQMEIENDHHYYVKQPTAMQSVICTRVKYNSINYQDNLFCNEILQNETQVHIRANGMIYHCNLALLKLPTVEEAMVDRPGYK